MFGIDEYTKLLLHGDGDDGSTTITDSSLDPLTVTRYGDTQIDTAQSKFGGASILFDGTGDYLSIPYSSTSDDLTVDFWFRLVNVVTNQGLCSSRASGIVSAFDVRVVSSKISCLAASHSGSWDVNTAGATTLSNGTWYHLAFVKNATSIKVYLNGVLECSGTLDTNNLYGLSAIYIGTGSGFSNISGWIDEHRVSNIARWAANFTPSTSAYSIAVVDKIIYIGDFSKTYSFELIQDLIETTKFLTIGDFSKTLSFDLFNELIQTTEIFNLSNFDIQSSIELEQSMIGTFERYLGDFNTQFGIDLSITLEKILSIGGFEMTSSWYSDMRKGVGSLLYLNLALLVGSSLKLKNNLNVQNIIQNNLILKNHINFYTVLSSELNLLNSLIGSVNGSLEIVNRLTDSIIGNFILRNKLTNKNEVGGTLTLKNNIDPQSSPPTYTDPEQDQRNFESGLTDPDSPNYNPQLASLTYFYFTEEHTG